MTQVVVVDANIALQWVVVGEGNVAAAAALLRDAVREHTRMLVPPHFFSEVSNALHQRTRTTRAEARINEEEADQALSQLLEYPLLPVTPDGLYHRAFHLARTHRLPSLYDALYLALADVAGCTLWTDDQRLIRSLHGTVSFVKWIGEYQP